MANGIPSISDFGRIAGAIGVGNGNKIIIYDANGGASGAARAWWLFRLFGHRNTLVLEGGLAKWIEEGRKTMPRRRGAAPHNFTPALDRSLVPGRFSQIVNADGDAESENAVVLPYLDFMRADDPRLFRPPAELQKIATESSLDLSQSIEVRSRHSISASMVAMGLFLVGKPDVPIRITN